MKGLTFQQIISLYPEIKDKLGPIQIGDVTALDIINFEYSSDEFTKKLRDNCVAEVRDLVAVLQTPLTVDDVQYGSIKAFVADFSIPNGAVRYFPFKDNEEVATKIKDAGVIGMIALKILEDNCERMAKISREVFDRSSLEIIRRIGSTSLELAEVKADFETQVREYTSKAHSFSVKKMIEIMHLHKGGNKVELDNTLIDMVFPQ